MNWIWRPLLKAVPLVAGLVLLGAGVILAQDQAPPVAGRDAATQEEIDGCMGCHSAEAESGPVVHADNLMKGPHAEYSCTTCHSSITDAPHTEEMMATKASCGDCHPEPTEQLAASIHSREDKVAGDHPKCATCHGGSDPHAAKKIQDWTRQDRVDNCTNCHRDTARMARYGPNVDAVESYEMSFHGRALLRFGNEKTAICMDCHGFHTVQTSTNPASSTSRENVAKTCGQPDCHPGATMNFAMSGAGHLHLRVQQEPLLLAISRFFQFLTVGTLAFLLMGVALDLRVAIFGGPQPPSGRLVSGLVAVGFLFLVAAIAQALFGLGYGIYSTSISVGFIVLALLANAFRKKEPKVAHAERTFQRFTVSQRIQHFLLMTSFITLVLTGMPIRYAEDDRLRAFYMALGGMPVMRGAHRVAAVILIAVWCYHTLELLVRWKRAGFTMESWTMWPRMKDAKDFFTTVKYHLGIVKSEPAYDRFQFREKFDYFAVYWGMPIMVISGLVLWFPVIAGSYLPELGIPIASIAHADESVLAFMTIVSWHFYNTHFSPNHFPMSPVWVTGRLTEEEMRREHPLELERLVAAGGPTLVTMTADAPVEPVEAKPVEPVIEDEPPAESDQEETPPAPNPEDKNP